MLIYKYDYNKNICFFDLHVAGFFLLIYFAELLIPSYKLIIKDPFSKTKTIFNIRGAISYAEDDNSKSGSRRPTDGEWLGP